MASRRMAASPEGLLAMANDREELLRKRDDTLAQHNPTINDIKRTLKRAEGRRNRQIKKIDKAVERLEALMGRSARRLRSVLITGRTKTARLDESHAIRFIDQEDVVVIERPEELVYWLERAGLADKYVIVEKRPNTEALGLKANRAEVEGIPCLHIASRPEAIYLQQVGSKKLVPLLKS